MKNFNLKIIGIISILIPIFYNTTIAQEYEEDGLPSGAWLLQDCYNSITYNYAHGGGIFNISDILNYYTMRENIPTDIINDFIIDCSYDVNLGERRPIEYYIDKYPCLVNFRENCEQKKDTLEFSYEGVKYSRIDTLTQAYKEIKNKIKKDKHIYSPDELIQKFPDLKRNPNKDRISDFIANVTYDYVKNKSFQLDYYIKKFKDIIFYVEPDDFIDNLYEEKYISMSSADGYISKESEKINLLYDEFDFIKEYYIEGNHKFLNMTQKDWLLYIEAISVIKNYVNLLNDAGYNNSTASDWFMANKYAFLLPELNNAINTYKKYNINNEGRKKLSEDYYNYITELKKTYLDMSLKDQEKMVDKILKEDLKDFDHETKNIRKKGLYQKKCIWNYIFAFIYGNYYEEPNNYIKIGKEIYSLNGKFYNSKNQEIKIYN